MQDVLPKDTFGQALTYLKNQFDPLRVSLDDGLMPIDNNETEQLMTQVAIGRQNWLFIGDIELGYRAADLVSLVRSAVRNDPNVFVYVNDVLDRLLAGETDYHALRPGVWKESHTEAVREYCQEERAADVVSLLDRCLPVHLDMKFHEVSGAALPNLALVQSRNPFDPGGEIPDWLLELLGRGCIKKFSDGHLQRVQAAEHKHTAG